MFTVVISEKGGDQRRMEFDKGEVTIGRVQGNDIILPKGNVSKRHSRIVLKDGKFIIVDIKSTNGTYVNGRKITSPLVIKSTDKIYIGDFILTVDDADADVSAGAGDASSQAANRKPALPPSRRDDPMTETDVPERPAPVLQAPRPAPSPVARPPAPAPPLAAAPPRPAAPAFSPPRQEIPREPPAPIAPPALSPEARAPLRPAAAPAPARPNLISNRPNPMAQPAMAQPAMAQPAARRPAAPQARPSDVAPRGFREALAEVSQRLALVREAEDGERVEAAVTAIIASLEAAGTLGGLDSNALRQEAIAEAQGFGPLEDLFADTSIREIHVARPDRIYVDRGGGATLHDRTFSSAAALKRVAERLIRRAGRRLETGLVHEFFLEDGTRVTVLLAPIASRGASLLVRRPAERMDLDQLHRSGVISSGHLAVLTELVLTRKNILVCGPRGSGRTTLLSALLGLCGAEDRIVTIEAGNVLDAGEQSTALSLGIGEQARETVQGALRLKPTRLAIDELWGAETLDVVSALAGGFSGALVVSGGVSVADALFRIEALAKFAAINADAVAIRPLVARSFDAIVQTVRDESGHLAVVGLYEASGIGIDGIEVRAMELG